MKKRLAIIGNGTAGALAAANFKRKTDYEIDWYYDPNIKPQSVGEASIISLPLNLNYNLGFTVNDLADIDGTIKLGIHKRGWGARGLDFKEPFAFGHHGIHFNAVKLQKYIFDKLQGSVNFIEKNVVTHDELDADFVFDCSGSPKDYSEFRQPETIPVNSVYVTQCYWDEPRFQWSLTFARPHGWVFGIPLQNRCSIGYLYNNNISTVEDVKEDVKAIFEEFNLTPSTDTNQLTFNNYYRYQNFNGRVGYSGNASFFLEPLEATSIAMMESILYNFENYTRGMYGVDQANMNYNLDIRGLENLIMMHYYAGSNFKSDFWEFAQDRARRMIDVNKNTPIFRRFIDLAKVYDYRTSPDVQYGTWNLPMMNQNLVNLDLLDL